MAETEIIMGNVMDYLEWRGDLTFDQSPFNDVDNGKLQGRNSVCTNE